MPVDPSFSYIFVLLIVFADSVLLSIGFFITITNKKKKPRLSMLRASPSGITALGKHLFLPLML